MNLRTVDPGCVSGGNQNPPEAKSGHSCINMVRAAKVVTHAKDYGSSQPNLGKEYSPPEIPLQIKNPTDKPEGPPCIPKGVLNNSGHNPNSQAA